MSATAIATKPVFVYNGFSELILPFNGKTHKVPFGKVIRFTDEYISAPDEFRRNHETDPEPTALLERTIPAAQFVEMLFNRHSQGYLTDRVVWAGDREPTKEEQESTKEFGRLKRIELVKQALADQQQALKGGGRVSLDPTIMKWLKEENIKDDFINPPKPADEGDIATKIANAIVVATQMAQQQQQARAK